MSISTKGGDCGTTSLMFGTRVSKSCARVRAYGTIDSFCAALGVARAFATPDTAKLLLSIQKNLTPLMTEIATAPKDCGKLEKSKLLSKDALVEIEQKIEAIEASGDTFRGWKYSGETPLNAFLDSARAACRTAERELVALFEAEPPARTLPLKYLNRLSDLLWLLAQQADK